MIDRGISGVIERYLRRHRATVVLALIGMSTFSVRLLMGSGLEGTALLYVGLPYAIALVLAAVTTSASDAKWYSESWNVTRLGLIVLLGSSALLMEGFLCVLGIVPIFLFFVLLGFLTHAVVRWRDHRRRGQLSFQLLPVAIFALAFEGVFPATSLDREEVVRCESRG